MRQIGGGLPEPPSVTTVEKPPEPEQQPTSQSHFEPYEVQSPTPHPVEVHRIERYPVYADAADWEAPETAPLESDLASTPSPESELAHEPVQVSPPESEAVPPPDAAQELPPELAELPPPVYAEAANSEVTEVASLESEPVESPAPEPAETSAPELQQPISRFYADLANSEVSDVLPLKSEPIQELSSDLAELSPPVYGNSAGSAGSGATPLKSEPVDAPRLEPLDPSTPVQAPPLALADAEQDVSEEDALKEKRVNAPAVEAVQASPPESTHFSPAQVAQVPPPKPGPTPWPVAEEADTLREPPELRITEAQPNLASGRWAEFAEPRRPELGRGSRFGRDLMPLPSESTWGLLGQDRPKRRSRFLTIVLPILAILAAAGAALWSGYLRQRLGEQDAQMSALQEQNRKLAQSLVKVTSDREGVSSEAASPGDHSPGSTPSTGAPQANAPTSTPPATTTPPSEPDHAQAVDTNGKTPTPAQSGPTGKREGVSTPPATSSARQRPARAAAAADAGYHPEIVPPYPTLPARQSAVSGEIAVRQSVPQPQQAYRQPEPVTRSTAQVSVPSPTPSGAAPGRGTQQQSTSQPAGASSSTATPAGYSAASGGMYASALAQNIEAVEGLQRQSPVPLREFHAHDGVQVKLTPGLYVALRSQGEVHGAYTLAVKGSTGSYQLRGRINSPLAFSDNATHREYQLVILEIVGGEAYGYVRPVR